MKSLFVSLILTMTTVAVAQLDHPNVQLATHESAVIGKEKSYYVYIPTTDDPEERFPVLYVLHGKWGSHVDWLERGEAAAVADRYRMMMVFPNGDQFSWYADSPLMEDQQYFTYITTELIDHIDATYPTIAERGGRAIMGLSMGGMASMNAAAYHPELFVSASSLSGVVNLLDNTDREDVIERLGPFEENKEIWKHYTVLEQVEKLRQGGVRLLFDCGVDDTKTGIIYQNRKLHAALEGSPHIYREFDGTHSWDYWKTHFPEHVNFHQAAFTPVQEQPRWTQHYFERLRKFFDENMALNVTPPSDEALQVALLGSSGFEGITDDLLPATLEDGTPLHFFNRGIGSDRLGIDERGLSRRLEESVFDLPLDALVINNGTNDIGELHRSKDGHPSIERMLEEYREILTTITARRPELPIILTTCAPVRDRFAHLKDSLATYNDGLRVLAKEFDAVLVDSHSATVDEDGLLREEFSADGLHFTAEAKELYLSMITEAIVSAVSATP